MNKCPECGKHAMCAHSRAKQVLRIDKLINAEMRCQHCGAHLQPDTNLLLPTVVFLIFFPLLLGPATHLIPNSIAATLAFILFATALVITPLEKRT